jgi:transcriptional regulator with XRE-family HTH domain
VFFDIFERACKENGIAPTRVLVDLGISKSSYGHWKNGGEASNRTRKAIADYFGLTVAELMSGETKKAPTGTEGADW